MGEMYLLNKFRFGTVSEMLIDSNFLGQKDIKILVKRCDTNDFRAADQKFRGEFDVLLLHLECLF